MRFEHYDGKVFHDPETGKVIADGSHFGEGFVYRTVNGFLDGGEDEAAIETEDSYREYRKNGYLHRADGPAVVNLSDRTKDRYFLNGKEVSKDDL